MLIVKVKSGKLLDKALKSLKRKVIQTKMMLELRDRREFKKKSTRRRKQKGKAIYVENKKRELDY